MTVVAVTLDPPREGLVLPRLPDTSPLTTREATRLYGAMVADACRAVVDSGGDLLVNYRPDDLIPDDYVPADADAEHEVRDMVAAALDSDELDDARFEVQVGSTPAARAGNTITHLLETENANSAATLHPDAPLVTRKLVDSAAMKLRRSPVVLGPSQGGRTYFAGFRDPIDFTNTDQPPELETLTASARDAGHDTDFLPHHTRVRTGRDLATLTAELNARRTADRIIPPHTATYLQELDLHVTEEHGERTLARD